MHAKTVPLVRFSTELLTLALLKFQDHNAYATNNSTKLLTDATIALTDNSHKTPTISKMVFVDNTNRIVVTK
jgi:hypothetical protein